MDHIVHLSDWHSHALLVQKRLEQECLDVPHEPDLVIITGDMIQDASERVSLNRLICPSFQPPHYDALIDAIEAKWERADIVAVRGNHDWFDYEREGRVVELGGTRNSWRWRDHLISGFRGVPAMMGSWNDELSETAIMRQCDVVDPETTILLTHCPPYGVLDDGRDSPKNWKQYPNHPGPRHLGSHSLKKALHRFHKLQAHCFGHVHDQGGRSYTNRGVRYSNASCTLNYFQLG